MTVGTVTLEVHRLSTVAGESMLIHLLESRAAGRASHTRTGAVSATVHATLVTMAVLATPGLRDRSDEPREQRVAEKLVFTRVAEPATPAVARPTMVAQREQPDAQQERPADAAPPVLGFQVLVPPVDIPTELPEIDLTHAVTDERNFSGRGVAGGIARAVLTSQVPDGPPSPDRPYYDSQVERLAVQQGGCMPRFPMMLSQAGIEGTVTAQFVVDTSGRAELGSFKVLTSQHELFDKAVRSALRCMRYLPAEISGRKVKQLVQQPFAFVLARRGT